MTKARMKALGEIRRIAESNSHRHFTYIHAFFVHQLNRLSQPEIFDQIVR